MHHGIKIRLSSCGPFVWYGTNENNLIADQKSNILSINWGYMDKGCPHKGLHFYGYYDCLPNASDTSPLEKYFLGHIYQTRTIKSNSNLFLQFL